MSEFGDEVARIAKATGRDPEEISRDLLAAIKGPSVTTVYASGEPPSLDPGQAIRSSYSRAVAKPVTDFVTRALNMLPSGDKPPSSGTREGPGPNQRYSESVTPGIARAVVPQTPEALALAAAAPGVARMQPAVKGAMAAIKAALARAGTLASVGGGTAAVTGGNPVTGAVEGAAASLPVEAMRGVANIATKPGRQAVADMTNLGDTMGGIDPLFRGVRNTGDFVRNWLGKNLDEKITGRLGDGIALLKTQIRNHMHENLPTPIKIRVAGDQGYVFKSKISGEMNSPPLRGQWDPDATVESFPVLYKAMELDPAKGFKFDEIDSLFRALGNKAYADGALLRGAKPQEVAGWRAAVEKEITAWLEKRSPAFSAKWLKLNDDYGRAKSLQRILVEPGVVGDNGRLDMQGLQKALKSNDVKKDLEVRLTAEEVGRLYKTTFRGAAPDVVDTKGFAPASVQGSKAGAIRAALSVRMPKYVGENVKEPANYATNAGRATMGLGRLFDAVGEDKTNAPLVGGWYSP